MSLKYEKKKKNKRALHKCIRTFIITSRSILLRIRIRIRNITDKCVEKIKTYTFYPTIFFSENPALYEIMWENVVEPDRTLMAI